MYQPNDYPDAVMRAMFSADEWSDLQATQDQPAPDTGGTDTNERSTR